MQLPSWSVVVLSGCAIAAADPPASPPAQQKLARAIYQQLIEINTTASSGDTAAAARAMAARLIAAGFAKADVQVLEPVPKKGNLIVRLHGTGKRKPLLLLAHLDVVEAKRTDWTTDPFKLVEKDGYFYGRGTSDDKFQAAAWVANLIRWKQEGYKPDRDLIMVLETDEEGGDQKTAGIEWLIAHHRDLLDAELALNEGGGVAIIDGKPSWNMLQTTEKLYQTFVLEVHNPGGHSSEPRADNAIYELAEALVKLEKLQFPVELNDTTRAYFTKMATIEKPTIARDMKAVLSGKPDTAALARLSALAPYNAQLRTTCVATRLEGGHAENALPQLARAVVNCRIVPGHPIEEIQAVLEKAIANPEVVVTPAERDTASAPSPIPAELVAAAEQLTARFWPGIPVVPVMMAGATDGRFLRNAGIPTYGHTGLAADFYDTRAHGKDERVAVPAFYAGVEYLYELVKLLAGGT
jgi:acetylornithine deacetylase/succinyl-diaminopimelate desuccinylase-like protein